MAIYFNPGDMDFIRKYGYDGINHRDDLTTIYNLDQTLVNDLHISHELDEVPPYYIAKMLEDNPRYAMDFVEVAAGYEKLALKGNVLAKGRLAGMYRCTNSIELLKKGLKYAEEAAKEGHMPSQMIYALYTKDPYWLQKAADAGYPYAQCELGCWYDSGENGLSKNVDKAKTLWERSNLSKGGFMRCMSLSGKKTVDEMLALVLGMIKGPDHYKEFYFMIGQLYEQKKDYQEAYRWYKKADDCGIYCGGRITGLYDKGFYGQEGRAYWEARNEELSRAIIKHDAYTKEALGTGKASATSSASNAAAPTSSSSSSSTAATTSFMDYYTAKPASSGKTIWIVVLILAVAAVAVKMLFF